MTSVLPDRAALLVPPRQATPRDPDRRTQGGNVAKIAAALGQPLMPWQRYVADVGGEVDAAGRYVHPLLVVSVPRQSGKTTLMLAQAMHRALQGPNRRVWFTAQTGQDARDKFRELAALVMSSPLRELVAGKPRFQAGSECLTFVNGSTLRPHPPTRDALHGKQGDHNDVDEGWSFDLVHGDDLLQAIDPTHATRPGAQTWVWSTRGDASSEWFHGLIDRGYAGEVALFDWGIPYGADATDLDLVAAHHPAIGHVIERDFLDRARVSMPDPAQFARAYGNVPTGGAERLFPAEAWAAAQTVEPVPPGRPSYGIAVSRDEEYASLYAAVPDEAGRPWLELIERRPGRSWLAERVQALRDYGGGVAALRNTAAGPVADALELAGVPMLYPAPVQYAAACGDFHDRICDDHARAEGPRLRLRAAEQLDAAAEVAGRRRLEEGGWVFSAKRSTGHTDTLDAAVLAAWAAARAPVEIAAPRVIFR